MNLYKSCLARWAMLASVAVAASNVASGASASKPDTAAQHAKDTADFRGALSDARGFAANGSVSGAEQALTRSLHAKANTAAWHMELAQRLLQTADQIARSGKLASVPGLANAALAHVTQADSLAPDAKGKAAAKSLAGFIYERYLGNPTAALASYQAAAKLSPTSNASRTAERLQHTQDIAASRAAGAGK
jgi:hypothetical protein